MARLLGRLLENGVRTVVDTGGVSATGRMAPEDGSVGSLQEHVDRNIRQGLAPPAEVHQVQNRSHIDWSAYPDWARPADPDMFDGCSHEG